MPIFVRQSGVWSSVTPWVRASGTWVIPKQVYVRVAGVWTLTFVDITASASPASVSGDRLGAGFVATGTSSVTVSGGTPPFSYNWTRTGGSTAIDALNPSASLTDFGGNVGIGETLTATFTCTVTDANGSTAVTGTVTAQIRETS